jgi:hypothetical protein
MLLSNAYEAVGSIAITNDRGFIAVLSTFVPGDPQQSYIQRFDEHGSALGSKHLLPAFGTSIAVDGDGDAIVISESVASGIVQSVSATFFPADGSAPQDPFIVATLGPGVGFVGRPVVAMSPSGDAIIAWDQAPPSGDSDIYARRFSASSGKFSPPFLVNTVTTASQFRPSVGMDAGGQAVVAWVAPSADPFAYLVRAQRYDAAGNKLGSEFEVVANADFESSSRVAMSTDGFAVAWYSPTIDSDIYIQRYTNSGARAGLPFRVNDSTAGRHLVPRVAANATGQMVVAWTKFATDGGYDDADVMAQRFDRDVSISGSRPGAQDEPAVSIDGNGNAWFVWESLGEDGSGWGVFGQRFNDAGLKVGDVVRVNTTTNNDQRYPAVAVDDDGDAVVVWAGVSKGYGSDVYAQRYDSSGQKVGGEVLVNTYTTGDQSNPAVAIDADGNYVVVWTSSGQDGDGLGVYGQRFNAAGLKMGGEFLVNSLTAGDQVSPAVTLRSDGLATIIWAGTEGGGTNELFVRQFPEWPGPIPTETPVNSTAGLHANPACGIDGQGNVFIVWEATSTSLTDGDILGRWMSSGGALLGSEARINSYVDGTQRSPTVAVAASGAAVVAWASAGQDGSGDGVFGQKYNAPNSKVGAEYRVNGVASADQRAPTAAIRADGNAVIAWTSFASAVTGADVIASWDYSSALAVNSPPKVNQVVINQGTAQRSRVDSLTVAFDDRVVFDAPLSEVFRLKRNSDAAIVQLSVEISENASGTTAYLTFVGGPVNHGSLADGRYTFTILASGVSTAAGKLDGNGDGVDGDDFILTSTGNSGVFRLFGDVDGDADVDATDFGVFRTAFGTNLGPVDFDRDGDVDATDFGQFRLRFGVPI